MDLNLLPEEMVANVLKYMDYATITRIRKLNKRTNNIAKAYACVRIPVTSICLTLAIGPIKPSLPWNYILEFDPNAVKTTSNFNTAKTARIKQLCDSTNGTHLDIIDSLLKRVKLNGSLKVVNFIHGIDDQLLAVFQRNRRSIRNMTDFYLSGAKVACSDLAVRNFIGSSRNLRKYQIFCSEKTINVFFQTEMLENRSWDVLSLWDNRHWNTFRYPLINDEYLLKVVKNCKSCTIDFSDSESTCFTLDGVLKLVEALIAEDITPEYLDLGSVKHNNTDWFQYAEDKLQEIDRGFCCTCDIQEDYNEDGTERMKNYFYVSTYVCGNDTGRKTGIKFTTKIEYYYTCIPLHR